jgi:hypothetical protein
MFELVMLRSAAITCDYRRQQPDRLTRVILDEYDREENIASCRKQIDHALAGSRL